ncbi:MAG: hypothetical protein IJW30_06980 [Clostridia bacterium]|nr:hypothetical protein [Clostridia bacterium]MBQ9774394.1 hypothetical protein [Clostridia bacterium]
MTEANAKALQVSAHAQIGAIEAAFSSRGLALAAKNERAEQEAREAQTRASEPLSYRLSTLPEGYVNGRYRAGNEVMSSKGLLTYIQDTRAMRTKHADFAQTPPDDDLVRAGDADKPMALAVRTEAQATAKQKLKALPKKLRALPARAVEAVRLSKSDWFNTARADTRGNTHRFPLSAFAAILAVAVSLMLIVASSVMITAGERELNTVSLEMEQMNEEVLDLRADLGFHTDLLLIRSYAQEELGMVSEDFLKMEYLSSEEGDSIKVIEQEKESSVGISALLSAIGLK